MANEFSRRGSDALPRQLGASRWNSRSRSQGSLRFRSDLSSSARPFASLRTRSRLADASRPSVYQPAQSIPTSHLFLGERSQARRAISVQLGEASSVRRDESMGRVEPEQVEGIEAASRGGGCWTWLMRLVPRFTSLRKAYLRVIFSSASDRRPDVSELRRSACPARRGVLGTT
jgi:hypothetical protein